MNMNHRQRITYRHCLKQAMAWTARVNKEQSANLGTASKDTVALANLWRGRFSNRYFKLHPDI